MLINLLFHHLEHLDSPRERHAYRLNSRVGSMFHEDPMMRRVSEIIDLLVEAVLYSHWNSKSIEYLKLHSWKTAIVHPTDEYYSFNL